MTNIVTRKLRVNFVISFCFRTLLKFWLSTGRLWRMSISRMGSLSSVRSGMREKIYTDTSSRSGKIHLHFVIRSFLASIEKLWRMSISRMGSIL